jgi:hypothetical protein
LSDHATIGARVVRVLKEFDGVPARVVATYSLLGLGQVLVDLKRIGPYVGAGVSEVLKRPPRPAQDAIDRGVGTIVGIFNFEELIETRQEVTG